MSEIAEKTLSLPASEVDRIDALIASGAYASAAEVISEALIALEERLTDTDAWLREEVIPAYDEYKADPSRAIPAEEVFARLRAHHAQRVSEEKSKSA